MFWVLVARAAVHVRAVRFSSGVLGLNPNAFARIDAAQRLLFVLSIYSAVIIRCMQPVDQEAGGSLELRLTKLDVGGVIGVPFVLAPLT